MCYFTCSKRSGQHTDHRGHFGGKVYNSTGHLVKADLHRSTWITDLSQSALGKIKKKRKLFELSFDRTSQGGNSTGSFWPENCPEMPRIHV